MARRMLAPINSIKHFVPQTDFAVATGTANNLTVVDAVVAPATGATYEVQEGAVVKAVWIELWLITDGSAGTHGTFTVTVEKAPGNLQPTFTNMLNLMSYLNKKNILYTTQGILSSDNVAQAVPILRQWIKIPKGKQRFGFQDRLLVNVANSGGTGMAICGMFIYKEYR